MLRKNGLVTGAAILSLSLALGACAAAFSLPPGSATRCARPPHSCA